MMQPPRSERELFTETLHREVAILQAQHPTLADGLSRAGALLAEGRLFPEEDGRTAMVLSSDGVTAYYVNGHCPCKASAYRQEPCKHRLALRLYQRVSDALLADQERWEPDDMNPAFQPPASQHTPEPHPVPLFEAPASCNVYVIISGHKVQVTLRDSDEQRMLTRLQTLLDRYPAPAQPADDTRQCPKHGVPLKRNQGKDGKVWWSHKTAEGWCKGK